MKCTSETLFPSERMSERCGGSAGPALSVCVPNFNHARYLEKALGSAWEQSFQPLEILVLDDGSTDESREMIRRFAERQPLVRALHNETNVGVVESLNRLLDTARGEFVHFLAADDLLLPGFYEQAMSGLLAHPGAVLSWGNTIKLVDETNTILTAQTELEAVWGDTARFFSPSEIVALASDGLIHGNTVIVQRRALIEAGGFLPELRWHTDWFANWVVALRHGVCFQPQPLAIHRVAAGQYSRSKREWSEQREIIRSILRFVKSPGYADVGPAFSQSGVLVSLGESDVACTVLETSDLLDEQTRGLVSRLFERKREQAVARTRLSHVRYSQYAPEHLRPRIRALVEEWQRSDARVVVFGAGEHTENLFVWTDIAQATIVAIVDSNPLLHGSEFRSWKVQSPAELPLLRPDVVLLSSASSQEEMYATTREFVDANVEIVLLYEEVTG